MRELMKVEEVADYCRVSNSAVWRWIRKQGLEATYIGGVVRIYNKDLQAFINRGVRRKKGRKK